MVLVIEVALQPRVARRRAQRPKGRRPGGPATKRVRRRGIAPLGRASKHASPAARGSTRRATSWRAPSDAAPRGYVQCGSRVSIPAGAGIGRVSMILPQVHLRNGEFTCGKEGCFTHSARRRGRLYLEPPTSSRDPSSSSL